MRVSTSFSEEEIRFLDELFKVLTRGGDVRLLLRAKALPGLMRKVVSARERLGLEATEKDPTLS